MATLANFDKTFNVAICFTFRFDVSDTLFREKEKTKAICDDLDSTFAELTGF